MTRSTPDALWEPALRSPRPVGFSAHLAAAFADGMILTVLGALLVALAALFDASLISRTYLLNDAGAVLFWGMCLAYSGSEILFGATPGKWLASVRLRTANSQPASRWRLLLRWAIRHFPLILLFAAAVLRLLAVWEAGGIVLPDDAPEFANADLVQLLAVYAAAGVALFAFAALLPWRSTLHDRIAGTNLCYDCDIQQNQRKEARGFEVRQVRRALPVDDPSL